MFHNYKFILFTTDFGDCWLHLFPVFGRVSYGGNFNFFINIVVLTCILCLYAPLGNFFGTLFSFKKKFIKKKSETHYNWMYSCSLACQYYMFGQIWQNIKYKTLTSSRSCFISSDVILPYPDTLVLYPRCYTFMIFTDKLRVLYIAICIFLPVDVKFSYLYIFFPSVR